jgi:hypothetical protein
MVGSLARLRPLLLAAYLCATPAVQLEWRSQRSLPGPATAGSRLLPFLQLLLLLGVSFFHSLRLLLVLLFHLLLSSFIGMLFARPLVLFFLLRREFLVFFFLLRGKLILLLLVFLVQLGVPSVRGRRT